MNTPTPETDAALRPWIDSEMPWVEVVGKVAGLARKLERERDQARQEPLFSQRLVPKLLAERDELRKVCDAFNEAGHNLLNHGVVVPHHITGEPEEFQSNPSLMLDAFAAYNQLPHVKGQSK